MRVFERSRLDDGEDVKDLSNWNLLLMIVPRRSTECSHFDCWVSTPHFFPTPQQQSRSSAAFAALLSDCNTMSLLSCSNALLLALLPPLESFSSIHECRFGPFQNTGSTTLTTTVTPVSSKVENWFLSRMRSAEFPCPSTMQREYSDAAVLDLDGSPRKGWKTHDPTNGDTRYGYCHTRHLTTASREYHSICRAFPPIRVTGKANANANAKHTRRLTTASFMMGHSSQRSSSGLYAWSARLS